VFEIDIESLINILYNFETKKAGNPKTFQNDELIGVHMAYLATLTTTHHSKKSMIYFVIGK
jgi:hypothetical protein